MPGSKRIVFTVNNPQGGNICALNQLMESDDVEWACYQFEQASTGTVHLQGAIYFKSRTQLATCARLLQGVIDGCNGSCRGEHVYLLEDTPELSD